nr:T6SS immunity protein Tdi1 domain-containing protein [uncultured Pseudomonas sp.]
MNHRSNQDNKGFLAFLLSISTDSNNYGDLFEPAYHRLGPLAPDEMYGFVPAVILGGPNTLEHLHKLKAVEHLILLCQVASLQGYDQ